MISTQGLAKPLTQFSVFFPSYSVSFHKSISGS
jgi:hypothetical protein